MSPEIVFFEESIGDQIERMRELAPPNASRAKTHDVKLPMQLWQCRLMLFLLQAQPQLFRWLQQPRTKNTSSLVLLSGGRALSRRASKIAAASSGAMEAGRPSSCVGFACTAAELPAVIARA